LAQKRRKTAARKKRKKEKKGPKEKGKGQRLEATPLPELKPVARTTHQPTASEAD
jgi:hypothetical protein